MNASVLWSLVFVQQGQQEPSERVETDSGGAAASGAGTAAGPGATASPGKPSSSERKAKKESKEKDKCVIL